MMKIGDVQLKGFAALAPMAGTADAAFRELCIQFGAAFTVSEMVSAKALTMGDKKSRELLAIGEKERPAGIQLFGYEPPIMAEATTVALEYSPLFIDINMGCPAPKIVKNKSGSDLMRHPELAEQIVAAVKKASTVPVSVKMRTGWEESQKNCVEFAKRIESAGADLITVHGRTREQMYAPPVDHISIRAVKNAVSIPVIGNGDITRALDADFMKKETGCDFLMVGRGALGNPWLFAEINRYFTDGTLLPPPTNKEKTEIMLRHAKRICELKGEKIGMCEIRKHALWYTKGLKGSAALRNRFSTVKSLEALQELADIIAGYDG